MLRTDAVGDELWALIEPVMPTRPGAAGGPGTTIGVRWRRSSDGSEPGSPWRDLPAEFGAWQSVAERDLRWSKDATYARVFAAVRTYQRGDGGGADLESLLSVDSTVVRAHQHAAGARPGTRTGG